MSEAQNALGRRARSGLSRCVPLDAVRRATVLAVDCVATICGYELAWFLRFDGQVPSDFSARRLRAVPVLLAARVLTLLAARVHRWSFRTAGTTDAVRLVEAQCAGTLAFALCLVLLNVPYLPRSIYVLELFFTTTFIAAFRFIPGALTVWYLERLRARGGAERTVVVGAGSMGELLVRDLRRGIHRNQYVVGFVDDDPAKAGTHLVGKPVLGRLRDLPEVIRAQRASVVMLAIARLEPRRIRQILESCAQLKVRFKIVPLSLIDLEGRVSAAMLHDLSPEDLLPREAVAFDPAEIRPLVAGRRALVTGGAGTIGSEIARQLAAHGIETLVLVDMNENELYLCSRRLAAEHPGVRIVPEVADIREPMRIQRLGARYRPHYVFHAAAHKHVPLMEFAPDEAVKNNVFGTWNVARMADACGAERFVLISTDKAVKPTSIMGATKRIAEMVVRRLARSSETAMTAVRFGNVLGSAGSVVPLFKQQIAGGGPVTVTHPDCRRYFMTVAEAVGLVLISGLNAYGELCVLDMGEPIRIADLARNLITMSGRVPDVEIPIVYTGLRPGEKLDEEVLTEEEEQTHEVRNRVRVARSPEPLPDLGEHLERLLSLVVDGDPGPIYAAIRALVPTYRITSNGHADHAGSVAASDEAEGEAPGAPLGAAPGTIGADAQDGGP